MGAAAGRAGADGGEAAEAEGPAGGAGAAVGFDIDGVNDGVGLLLAADVSGGAVSAITAGGSAAAWPAATAFALPSAATAFALPMVSAGSGGVVPDVVFFASLAAGATSSAGASSMAPASRWLAAERDDPALIRDGDMMPLLTTVSAASPSGSASRPGGAMMSDG